MAEYEKEVRRVLKEYGCSFVRHGKVIMISGIVR